MLLRTAAPRHPDLKVWFFPSVALPIWLPAPAHNAESDMADSPCPNTTAVRRAPRGSGAADRTAIDSGTAGEPAAGGVSAAGAPAGRSNAGGTQRTAAHLAHAPAGRSARAVTAFDRKLMLIGLLLHSATQVVSLMAWHTLPFSEKSQRLGSIVFAACSWLLPTLAPAFYLRWRKELIILYRICFFAFPLLRKARGIQQVMEDAAQQGARGAVKDLFKIFWGEPAHPKGSFLGN